MNKKRYLVITVIVVAAVLLVILLDAMLANHLPAITSLEAAPERVLPSGSCQIMCNATDRDGDELSYNWSAIGGEINGEGATVIWTAPNSVGFYDVTVIVTDGRGDVVTKKITIEVRANKPPTINSLIAEAEWTLRSGSLNVTCDASDPDGDELSYEWSTSGGIITGTGTEVVWTAPQDVGRYDITVVVSDGYGGSDTRTLAASVLTGQPPIIEKLEISTVCRNGVYKLVTTVSKPKVEENLEYDIECIVADAGTELFYQWSSTRGEISGEGPLIAWIAPNKPGDVTVTVIVSDVAGNMASRSITLDVVGCSPCTRWPPC